MRFRGILWALLAALTTTWLAPAPIGQAQTGGFSFTLVHTNDTHAHIAGFQPGSGLDCVDDRPCVGGVARRKTVLDQIRAANRDVLLVDAGDVFQGTLFYNQYKGDESVPFMNTFGYQGMAVGNHEFDDGPANLAKFAKQVNFPLLSANLDVTNEPLLRGLIKPWTVVEVGGRKIGLFGLTTTDTATISSPGRNVKFTDDVAAARQAVRELQAQGVNIIIGLTHIGYERDQMIAKQVDGIDIMVGGHTHTPLGTTDPKPDGPYPTVVASPSGASAAVVTSYQWGQVLGQLDVTFDDRGVLTRWQGKAITLDRSVPEDPAMLAQVDTFAKPLAATLSVVVGQAADEFKFDASECRVNECVMGNLIADALLWATKGEGSQIAIFNGGGIRSSLPKGAINAGDVRKAFPFANTIATFQLTGADVLAALENGLSRLNADSGSGRFAQVGGLRYAYDAAKPIGQRVVRAEVGEPRAGYRRLDPTATYKVVSNDFVRKGGDDYAIFRDRAINPYDAGAVLADALTDYIKANSPIKPTIESRIVVGVSGWAAQSTAPIAQLPSTLPRTGDATPTPIEIGLGLVAGSALVWLGWRRRRRVA